MLLLHNRANPSTSRASTSMTCLPDVNVWLALAVDEHTHHGAARLWESQLSTELLVFCRTTELGLFRLLTNARVMNDAPLTAAQAWSVRDRIFDDPRVSLIAEPRHFDEHWRRTARAGKIGPHFWTDAYLATLCAATDCTLITFDRKLARSKKCSTHLLEATAV